MSSFKDRRNQDWILEITIGGAKRVRDLVGVDIYKLTREGCQPLQDLLSDPIKLVDCVFVLCQPQAETRKVTDLDFGELIAGESLMAVTQAFMDALADFSQSPSESKLVRAITKRAKEAETIMERKIGEMDQSLNMEDLIQKLSAISGKSPEFSALIPGH